MAITTSLAGHRDLTAAAFKSLFPGRTPDEVARAAGAIEGSHVQFSSGSPDYVMAQVTHPLMTATRIFTRVQPRQGKPFLVVEHAAQSTHPVLRGEGYKRFADVIQRLRGLGVAGATMALATGNKGGADNGYYTWPRFAWQGQMKPEQFAALPADIQGKMGDKRDFHTLFALPGGSDAWKAVGTPAADLHFDLREGSEHLKRFQDYHAKREQQNAAQSGTAGSLSPVGAGEGGTVAGGGEAAAPGEAGRDGGAAPGFGVEQRLTKAVNAVRKKQQFRRQGETPDQFSALGRLLGRLRQRIFGGGSKSPIPAPPTTVPIEPATPPTPTGKRTSTVDPTKPYTPSDPEAAPRVGSPDRGRNWDPKYPGFAVSPQQGLYDNPDESQPFEPAPATSHLLGWRLNGGGFVKKFYGPTVDAPKGTSQVLSVKFRSKKQGHTEYEYYFNSEEEAEQWLAKLRAAVHPGKVIWSMIHAEIPYKRKYWRQGELVVRYSRSYFEVDSPVRFAIEERPAHSLIHGFRIEHALRHLVNDPATTTTTKTLASMVLHDGNTDALLALNDSLQEQGHPLWSKYNWYNAAHKIHIDDAVDSAIKAVMPHEDPPFENSLSRRMFAVDTLQRTHDGRVGTREGRIVQTPYEGHPAVAASHDALDELEKHLSPEDISESLNRHFLRNSDEAASSLGFGSHETIRRAALDPGRIENLYYHPEEIRASRYRRTTTPVELRTAFNSEFNRVADRLNEQRGVSDLDKFKNRDHFGLLLAATGSPELASDTATDLIYNGGLEKNHRPGGPLTPVVKNAGRFAVRTQTATQQRQLAGTLFTDLQPNSDNETAVNEGNIPESASVGNSGIVKPQSQEAIRSKTNRQNKAQSNNALLAQKLLTFLGRRGGESGIPIRRLHKSVLPFGMDRIKEIANLAGAVVHQTNNPTGGRASTKIYSPGVTPPVDASEAQYRQVDNLLQSGQSRDEIANRINLPPTEVSKIIALLRRRTRRSVNRLATTAPTPRVSQQFQRTVDRAVQFLRGRAATDFVSALRRVRSQQQDVLRRLAQNIHHNLNLQPSSVRDAVWDNARVAATANTVQAVQSADPLRSRVAAAWYGLQSQTPSILVFHVDSGGPEAIHKIAVSGSGEKLRASLSRSGLTQRVMLPTKDGWETLIYDRDNSLADRVQKVATENGGTVAISRGRGEIVGGSEGNDDARADAQSRRTYRQIIQGWEQLSGGQLQQPLQSGNQGTLQS